MSLQQTKQHLLTLVADPDNAVIALSGKWGTGKTYMLTELMGESEDEAMATALSVSLFGLSSIDQVKRKLIESVAPGADSHPKLWEGAKQAVNTTLKALEGFHKGFAALSDLNLLLLAPSMLGGKLIVIDDIERKHDKLGVDEILGFIDEYTEKHGARFILLLNSDQLADRKLWDTFREKVIDQELKLRTTAEEAFDIAAEIVESRYEETIKAASITCGLTNIRIISKVVKAANRILGDRALEPALLERVIPSVVLFSAIHYKGLEDGPDVQFVLSIGSTDWRGLLRDQNDEPTEEENRRARWELLVKELGILACDEFEALVVEFLESGLFDDGKLAPIIERYASETQNFEARKRANDFAYTAFWDHRVTDAQLLEMAADLPGIAPLLDAYTCSDLSATVSEIPGGAGIGQAMIDAWIATFRAEGRQHANDDNPFNRQLHAAIADEFKAANEQAQASTTVVDACMFVIENSGWGAMQEFALRGATAEDFEAAIRGMEIHKLRRFMRRMIEMRIQRTTYDTYFGTATQRFVDACCTISNDQASPRLAKLIQRLFAPTVIAAELNPPQDQVAVAVEANQ